MLEKQINGLYKDRKEMDFIKIKDWIRNKVIRFLLIDDMQKHNLSEIERLDSLVKLEEITRRKTDELLKETTKSVNTLHSTIRNVVSVGTDVVPNGMNRDRSWAVVCIEGKCNVVKFIDLYGADYRIILDFLKQYEGSRMVIDAPNRMMFDDLFKF